ncbi:MAG: sigma-54 dependent transcriptional regulator [gamma proteobacterium symbiont of Lucinoma myriamae]|nr:sigma-54 dependent transcriptional regulator [gamma proteobacterium symbiont of Lucinoma myriamae]MCU7831352.1 sigma-54 dependent transcriptional regulator [gamma proteobacterium symbiont of Lucinoma myriamae]
MTKHLALIVDDEPDICELLELTLNRMDIDTLSAGDLKTAYQLLTVHNISICLTDMRLPDGNGIELVKKIQTQSKHIPVAMISAHGNMDTAIEALKAGAFDFVSKPLELAELRNLVNSAIKLADKDLPQNTPIQNTASDQADLPKIVDNVTFDNTLTDKKLLLGNSPAMQETNRMIVKLAKSQAPIYISGESGTGKELATRQIHQMSSRSDKPFIPVNCGAIPSELMESEFFGHIKGSFTGANKDKQGLFQAASGGTLFLDEVADLPLSMQVKLLRAIQEKAIRSVGSQKEEKTNVRIISATHKNLKQLVADGEFREDLYYRINVIELLMPPLRKRSDDVNLLCDFFLEKFSFDDDYHLSTEAADILKHYSFPGNVRELENILERAVTLCDESIIQAHDLSLQEAIEKTPHTSEASSPILKPTLSPLKDEQQIKQALEDTHWNRKAAAELLGVTYRQFRYSLKKLGID